MELGQVTIMAVETILTWNSCDGGGPDEFMGGETRWDRILKSKRRDSQYQDVLDSIEQEGFIRPLTATVLDGKFQFGDGHHRLAAAIDLGLTHVLIELHEDFWDALAPDSGSWTSADRVPLTSD